MSDGDHDLVPPIHPDDLQVPVRAAPACAETGPAALIAPITPNEAHFVRSHFDVPSLERAALPVLVDGAVAEPLSLSIAELRGLPQHHVTMTMECAGASRLTMQPLPRGLPFGHGAVATASWSGVPLGLLLDRAGLRDDVLEILISGADRGTLPQGVGPVAYARSLPLAKAREPNVLLALEMNGAPLPIEHGAPVRLVVPGWYGMASVKWVVRVTALVEPFAGWFQAERYVYVDGGRPRRPVDVQAVKSLIVWPEPGRALPAGRLDAWGWAWSGAAPIAAVEVALDDGPWGEAELDPPLAPNAWRRFHVSLDLTFRGRHTLRSRARDAAGGVQPDVARWNAFGYGNNSVAAVAFQVV